jgi:serine/threonine protein kinase
MAPIVQQATLPTHIGTRYAVLQQLGRGGSAIVYRVRDTASQTDFALKQLIAAGENEHQHQLRTLFEREFYVLAQLSHPSVVQVFDFETDATGPFYTMELLEGGDLKSRSPLPFLQCCELGVQVCSALAFLHSRRYVHRDLSPRNLHFTRDGRAKLIDFGALVPMGPCRQVVGTPAFTAPESIHGMTLDARTDLCSFGATLYYALTGRAAFAASAFEDLRAAWRATPVAPSIHVAGIPPEHDLLVL